MGLCYARWPQACIYTTYFLTHPPQITVLSENYIQLSETSHMHPLCKLHGIMMITPFVGLFLFKVHRFHFVLALSSPSVPFCSLSYTATARTSLTFSLGIPLTLLYA